jgi:hypothetical protein
LLNFYATDNIKVAGYLITETSSKPSISAAGWAMNNDSYTFSSSGPKILYGWAKDIAGNVSLSLNDSVRITLAVLKSAVISGDNTKSVHFQSSVEDNNSDNMNIEITGLKESGISIGEMVKIDLYPNPCRDNVTVQDYILSKLLLVRMKLLINW